MLLSKIIESSDVQDIINLNSDSINKVVNNNILNIINENFKLIKNNQNYFIKEDLNLSYETISGFVQKDILLFLETCSTIFSDPKLSDNEKMELFDINT